MDYHLNKNSEVDILRVLKQYDLGDAAVIITSDVADNNYFKNSIDNGAQDFLLKNDVDICRLMHAVTQAQRQQDMAKALKNSQEKLRDLTENDLLTDLYNRYGFELCLARAVSRSRRQQTQIAVLLLDVDDFKSVNDTLSHSKGDLLLKQIASRLSKAKRNNDILARLGGDEFAVLATDLTTPGSAYLLAKRLLEVFSVPFVVGDSQIVSSASVGIATLSETANNVSELMKCADIAMYRGKKHGRNNIQFYSEKVHREVTRKVNLERDLRKAINKGELDVYYQAQVSAVDARVVGAEALIRWHHPTDGLIMPTEFLSIAEEAGFAESIGEWVMQTACRQVAHWNRKLADDQREISVAVNLSAAQIKNEKILDTVLDALDNSGLSPSHLELEITESALIDNPEKTAIILQKIVQQGVTMALDDFGTGYSSLQHLKLFPIKVLKIDRGFVLDIGKGSRGERLLAAMINFARAFQVRTVAEGVEGQEQSAFCSGEGCDVLQGYYYSVPVSATEFQKNILHV